MTSLTIGKLANACCVNVETIRYYQRKNLITEPEKPLSGYRQYPHSTINIVKFIKRAQHLGFSLKEIKQLLVLGDERCSDVQQLAIEKKVKITEQIAGLTEIQQALALLISQCHTDEGHCGFIDALFQQGFIK